MSNVVAKQTVSVYTKGDVGVLDTLRRAMEASGQTRYAIAKRTGISQNALGRFAAGKVDLRGENIDRLAAHLGLVLVIKRGKARKGK